MTTSLTRRDLLRLAGASGVATLPGLRGLAFAAGPAAPAILIVVHLRGGCDALNLVSPADAPPFIAARPPELRVLAEGPDAGHALKQGPDPAIDFRLHTAAAPLAELYGQGQLAFVHAVGVPDANRSHFVATDMIEHGVGRTASLTRIGSGWLARYLQSAGSQGEAACAAGAVSGEYAGDADTVAVPNLDGGFGLPGGKESEAVLSALYEGARGPVGSMARRTLAAVQKIDRRLARDARSKVLPYRPPGRNYDAAGPFGAALRTAAQLVKMEIGLSAVSLDIGGWDTHENQPGRFKNAVMQLARGLATFWDDMAAYHDRLLLVTVSEFGRRFRSNKSNGTDHGRAGLMAVLGGRVNGGRILGSWPGLDSARLEEGVDLAVTTDYRLVLSEILAAHGGRKLAPQIFPDYRPTAPLGLLRT
jgi:uncharacterized protein (DUF1501 family)